MVEKISKYTLWAGMIISLVILVLFFLIGFDQEFEENPKFNNPALTDVLLIWTYFLVAAAIGVTLWSLFHGLTTKGTGTSKDTGLAAHTNSIAWGICVVSLALGAIYGFMCKDDTMMINNVAVNNIGTDIILTDTCMISIVILTIVTIAATAWSMVSSKN